MAVKRYDIHERDDGEIDMGEFVDGEYVTFDDYDALAARLAEAERDAARYRYMRGVASFRDRNGPGLYWYLPRFLPGGSAEQLDASIDASITADSASVVQYKPCEICTTQSWCETHGCQCYPVSAVQPERCCLDYPRCDCNSPPEPDDDWLCFRSPAQPKVTP